MTNVNYNEIIPKLFTREIYFYLEMFNLVHYFKLVPSENVVGFATCRKLLNVLEFTRFQKNCSCKLIL